MSEFKWNRQFGTDGFCDDCEWYESHGDHGGNCHVLGPNKIAVAFDDWCPKWESRRKAPQTSNLVPDTIIRYIDDLVMWVDTAAQSPTESVKASKAYAILCAAISEIISARNNAQKELATRILNDCENAERRINE